MKNGFSEFALGDLLEQVDRTEQVRPDKKYRLLGVRLEGRGAFHRETKLGTETSAPALNQVREGDFIYSRLYAWKGAFSLIDSSLDSCFVSNEFPLFRPKSSAKIDLRYLRYWFRLPTVWRTVEEDCKGSTPTTRNRFNERFFERLKIPLPPLAEQERIVARLVAIEQRLNRIQKLREESEKEFLALLTGMSHRWELTSEEKAKAGWSEVSLGEILTQTADSVVVDATQNYPNLGIYSYARGTFTKPVIEGSKSSAPSLFRVRAGQFIYSRLFAFEGAYGLVDENQDGFFVSNEFPSFEIDHERMLPEFLMAYFKSKTIWDKLASQSTGLGDRRRRVHPDIILGHRLHLPPIKYQQSVKEAFQRLNKVHRASIKAEHEALMPSLLDRIFNQPN